MSIRRINAIATVLLLLFTLWFAWIVIEKSKLNQQYRELIELEKELAQRYELQVIKFEEVVTDYRDILRNLQDRLEGSQKSSSATQ